jgi:hypothetical protein|tara:strand:+ start:3019 stop:3210 length:192 start_codon:yes stop_codon:yes gene_type:complete
MVDRIPIVVAYKLKNKTYVKQFNDLRSPDPIITKRSKKLPIGSEIIHIGVGKKFINQFKLKYQ